MKVCRPYLGQDKPPRGVVPGQTAYGGNCTDAVARASDLPAKTTASGPEPAGTAQEGLLEKNWLCVQSSKIHWVLRKHVTEKAAG